MQREGIDFDDTFAPVAQMESVRFRFALAAQEGWRVFITWTSSRHFLTVT
jgi:hypothetical protein